MLPCAWWKERFRPDRYVLIIGLTPLFVLGKAASKSLAPACLPLRYRVVEAMQPKLAGFLIGGN